MRTCSWFKTPLVRGAPNTQLDQFQKIEALISSDLDHWLCNLYFQVKRLPLGTTKGPGRCGVPSVPLAAARPDTPPREQLHSKLQLRPQTCGQQQPPAGPGAGPSHRGSPLHLSADSACSSSSLPGKNSSSGAISGNIAGERSDPCGEKADDGIPGKKKPIKKTNSRGPSVSRRAGGATAREETEDAEEMEEHTFSLRSALPGCGPRPSRLSDRARLALRMLPSELGLPLPRQQQPHRSRRGCVGRLGLIIPLLALMWFARLYLHYCSQWLYLQAIAVPVN
ncbi:uncharacterized protein LOC142882577, partial [Nelusetta ayraudi]|uniref:uncharacterized protein LOC142882577 n=1 Tax=Nelusetta ayraudi TaxID=303726 RepID=UPI003F6E5F71